MGGQDYKKAQNLWWIQAAPCEAPLISVLKPVNARFTPVSARIFTFGVFTQQWYLW